jgi:hypothetical protein
VSAEESKTGAKPIGGLGSLEELLEEGYVVAGPRGDGSRDLASFRAFLKRGYEFATEESLVAEGYQAVEASPFTKGVRLLFKVIDDVPDQRIESGYTLSRGDEDIQLYLKKQID